MITYQQYCDNQDLHQQYYQQFVQASIIGQLQLHYNVLQVMANWSDDPKWVDKVDWAPMAAYILAFELNHYEKLFHLSGTELTFRRMVAVIREGARMYSNTVVRTMLEEIDEISED